jgi:hypothetical protein
VRSNFPSNVVPDIVRPFLQDPASCHEVEAISGSMLPKRQLQHTTRGESSPRQDEASRVDRWVGNEY